MAGRARHLVQTKDFKDPFNAGQMVGMLVMLTFLEKNGGLPQDAIDKLKWVCATNAHHYLEKPAEDIILMANSMINEIERMQ